MNKDEVLRLAKLSRIELNDKEAEGLSRELDAVLGYVGEVKKVRSLNQESRITDRENYPVRNVMREDSYPHESGLYTKDILKQAPNTEGDYIRVKKIL